MENTIDREKAIELFDEAENFRTGSGKTVSVIKAEENYKLAADAGSDIALVSLAMIRSFNEYLPERLWIATRELLLFRLRAYKLGLENIPYNMTLEFSDETELKSYAKTIGEILENILPEKNNVFFTDENAIFNGNMLNKSKTNSIIFISGCTDNIFDKSDIVKKEFAACPEASKILCLSREQAHRLRSEYEIFFFSVIGHEYVNHASLTSYRTSDILPAFLHKISSKYPLSDEFVAGITDYIRTIYPDKVNLKGKDFTDDLYERVMREFMHKKVIGDTITADCVPYYNKPVSAEAPKPEEAEQAKAPEVKPEPTKDEQAKVPEEKPEPTKDEQAKVPEEKPEPTLYTKETLPYAVPPFEIPKKTSDEQNVLILSLSTFPVNDMKEGKYTYKGDDGTTYTTTGIYQLDAVPRILSQMLKDSGKTLDKIICLCTEQTQQDTKKSVIDSASKVLYSFECSPLDFFKAQVRNYLNASDEEDRIEVINIDKNFPAPAIAETVERIRSFSNARIYFDNHGSLREIAVAMEAILSLVQNELNDKMTVISVQSGGNGGTISKDKTHDLFTFVSGLNEFLSFGRADQLEKYLKDEDKELTTAIKTIADAISVCNTDQFDEGIKMLREYYKPEKTGNTYLSIFSQTMKNEFSSLLEPDSGYLAKIEWCRKRKLYQPALTIMESKMPAVLLDPTLRPAGAVRLIRENYMNDRKVEYDNLEGEPEFYEWIYKAMQAPYIQLDGSICDKVSSGKHIIDADKAKSLKIHYKYIFTKNAIISDINHKKLEFLALGKALKQQRNHVNHIHANSIANPAEVDDAIKAYIYLAKIQFHYN